MVATLIVVVVLIASGLGGLAGYAYAGGFSARKRTPVTVVVEYTDAVNAVLGSNQEIAKAALLNYRGNKDLEAVVRELSSELALQRQLAQIRHAAVFVHTSDDERIA